MIRFDAVSVTYPHADSPTLDGVTFDIPEGEFVLVVGPTGSGKSTLLRCINGLVPHFTGGTLTGTVQVDGRDTEHFPPRELADVVGMVPQDPINGFVTSTVEEELAYGMECLGVDPVVMRKRVEEVLDVMGLADVRDREIVTLSGGQQQRVAIGAVLTAHPKVIVLDEPTSALDPAAAEEVLASLQRLVHDVGLTVVIAEHRLERVVQYADRVIVVPGTGQPIRIGLPADVMAATDIAPPVVELGRLLQWSPLPLSIRDARRAAGPLRDLLRGAAPPLRLVADVVTPIAHVSDVGIHYGSFTALDDVSLDVNRGDVVALMGRNGAGKSTLLNALVGIRRVERGTITIDGRDPSQLPSTELLHHVGLVPQEPADLLSAQTVAAECKNSDRDANVAPGTTRAIVALLAPDIVDSVHPRDLSEGQRLLLVLAIVLAARPPLLLLDEPTRGLDYPTKTRLGGIIRDLADGGHAIVLATHDVELAAELASRVVVLADGHVVADGDARQVLTASPLFAPQVAKVVSPLPWLTVSDVRYGLAELGETS